MSDTADRLIESAAGQIMRVGYNGFSYADLAAEIGIRKASIHHHFPAKADLVVAVVEAARAAIRAQTNASDQASGDAVDRLAAYVGRWATCIADRSAPFCLAAVLAAELPSLPDAVAGAVRGHFHDLTAWLAEVLAQGERQGTMRLDAPPEAEAEALLSTIYGAMLVARAFDDPARFPAIAQSAVERLLD